MDDHAQLGERGRWDGLDGKNQCFVMETTISRTAEPTFMSPSRKP